MQDKKKAAIGGGAILIVALVALGMAKAKPAEAIVAIGTKTGAEAEKAITEAMTEAEKQKWEKIKRELEAASPDEPVNPETKASAYQAIKEAEYLQGLEQSAEIIKEASEVAKSYGVPTQALKDAEECLAMVEEAERSGYYVPLLHGLWATGYAPWVPKEDIVADIARAAQGTLNVEANAATLQTAISTGNWTPSAIAAAQATRWY